MLSQQIMEKQNTASRAKTASILDSLLQADVAGLKRQQQVTYWPALRRGSFCLEVIMEQYLIYLRKSRSDLEAEAHGEGETLSRARAHSARAGEKAASQRNRYLP